MFPFPSLARLHQGKFLLNRLGQRARHVFAGLFAGVLCAGQAYAAPSISVLVAAPTGIYQETADSLSQALKREGWKVTVSVPGQAPPNGADLTVAIGTRALEAALAGRARPVLSLLVPQLSYEQLASGQDQVTALYLDQPLTRQLQLLGLALPGVKKVGVALGPDSRSLLRSLQSAAKSSGIQVNSALINQGSDLYAALTDLAQDSQAFMLLPDPMVAQRSMLHNFFLHTYRLKKPVLAYSAPLARSGALLALYSTPEQLGAESAAWMRESWARGKFNLGAPRYPERFTVAINRTVASSLEIELPSEDTLTRQLEAMQ